MAKKPAAKPSKAADDITAIIYEETGYTPGCRSQGPEETEIDFRDRIIAEFEKVITACEGSMELAALIFDIQEGLLRDLSATVPDMEAHLKRAAGLMILREKRGDELANLVKEEKLKRARADKYTRKKIWPKDAELRRRQITKALTDLGAMRDYSGSTIQMASPMQLTPEELDAVIQANPDLVRLQRIEQTRDDAAAERNLLDLAATGSSPTAPMKVLTNRHPEKYSDKQQIDVKKTGFAAPESAPENVLFKEKKKCDED